MIGRYSKWLVGLAATSLFAQATVACAGVADTPLPTFSAGGTGGAALAVYYAVGVVKNNGLETDFFCTNTTNAPQDIMIQLFDELGGPVRNTPQAANGEFLSVPAGRTVTFATGGTAQLHEDQTALFNALVPGTNGIANMRNGSARIVATSKSVSCTAMLFDKFHIIVDPACTALTVPPCPAGHLATEASPTGANLPLIKLP